MSFVLGLVAGLFLWNAERGMAKEPAAPGQLNPGPGMPAPAWQLKDLHGASVQFSDFKGRVVILDFWATWYPQSREEVADLAALQKQEKKRGLVVVGIAVDDTGPGAVSAFVKAHQGIDYPILLGDDMVRLQYGGIASVPTTFIINRHGIIADVHQGPVGRTVLQNDLKKLL